MKIKLFDSKHREALLPFTFTRPIAEIRVGILKISEKWHHYLQPSSIDFITTDYLQPIYPQSNTNFALYINGAFLPNFDLANAVSRLNVGEMLTDKSGEVIALKGDAPWETLIHTCAPQTYNHPLRKLTKKSDIFQFNGAEIQQDFILLTKGRTSMPLPNTCQLLGEPQNLFIEEGAQIECSTLNCKNGVIYIGKNAEIQEGCNVRGNLAILEHAQIKMGTRIYGDTTIGPHCRVGGEVSNLVMFGYSNKGHDGFVGNAVIGEWCNLGAGTNASNLKNNYGSVKQYNYATQRFEDTQLQFCGLMMGDHTKCSIGTQFNTATVVGVASQLFGSQFHSNFIPSFSFGNQERGYTPIDIEKVIESEIAMMQRRNKTLSETYCQVLRTIFNIEQHNRKIKN